MLVFGCFCLDIGVGVGVVLELVLLLWADIVGCSFVGCRCWGLMGCGWVGSADRLAVIDSGHYKPVPRYCD